MRPTILSFLFLLILHSVYPTWSIATEETITFRYGLDGYTGVRDTFISTLDWGDPPQDTANYGQNEAIVLSRDGGENPLVRFALEAIPPNSRIASAALSLYNTVPSSLSGSRDFARRIMLHQTLVDWDEGNQQDSPINASGKRGATGYNAFAFFSGEGVNVPWAERGMKAGADYKEKAEGYADVVNEGWYDWDVTSLVQQWVRYDAPNFGVTLRDATSFQDDHRDNREFVSSQSGDATLRPTLTVVYNPDVPFAQAGVDQENLQWNGGSVRLDGSGSSDRPGGNDAALAYSWRITAAAYGSSLTGAVLGTTAIVDFVPDRAGEWDVELTVTNEQGESATDTVHLRLLRIPASHPRIYLDPAKLAQLKSLAVPSNPRWIQLKDQADQSDGDMQAKALVWQITGEEAYADEAIALALDDIPSLEWAMKAGNIALVFDWCYSRLTPQQVSDFVAYFNAWDGVVKEVDEPGWGNYWPGWSYSYALIGLASYGDNPRAQEWMDEYRHRRYRDNDLSLLNQIADSGAWPEGTVYDGLANRPRIKAIEAWRTATGEDLFQSTAWFRNRLGYLLLRNWPGEVDEWGTAYRPYPATGDSERNRGSMANYSRIMGLILAGHYPQDPIAAQLHAYLATAPVNRSMDFVCHDEFLWFNPDQSSSTPEILTHYAKATGTLFMRSGWPDDAADTLTSPTYLTFQCGDHFTYHQHFEQNSFTLFKYGDLAVDSGVYSGDGLSNHDINYYVRTIAHNTLAVYNPKEDFSSVRADASSNDGGQRTMYPASRSPQTVAYFQQYQTQYDNGDILRYEDNSYFTYALGDATKAYNNPSYNQAMDTDLTGNIAKVSRFQREFVYLRSPNSGGQDYLVLLDRVGVTQADFSGPNTKLLFHTMGEPVVNGTAQTITPGEVLYGGADLAWAVSGDGKLFLKFLLPLDRNVRKVGGRGAKAFWVFGKRYDWQWEEDEDQPRPINEYEDVPYGEWRLELEPADPLLNHTFLTVLFPTSSTVTAPPAAQVITAGTGMTGVYIPNSALDRVALFSSAIDGSAPSGIISYQYPQAQDTHTTLFDLTPGARYRLTATLEGGIHHITLTPDVSGTLLVSDQGVLSFSSSTAVFYVSSDGSCGDHTPCYTTIQSAINAAPSGATIRIAEGTYGQAYALNNGRVLTLKGRWNKDFTAQTGNPTIIKAPSGVVGGLTFQEVSMAP